MKVLLRKAVALEGLRRYAEARACLDAAAQCGAEAQYADTLRQLRVRVDLALAFAQALDTWGDAPDAYDRVCRAFAEATAALAPRYGTAPAPAPSAAPTFVLATDPAHAHEARSIRRMFHRMFRSDDDERRGGSGSGSGSGSAV